MKRLWGFGVLALLVGCSTPKTKASKDLCSGTKRPYTIQGIKYTPQEHYDYEEHGVASWYGPGFHKRPTSCGSIYDMHSLTAAHKTLPIPSVVEVTNLDNGKNLVVVVNDRGPFVDDRIIDLSKRAAQELGTHNRGLGKVRVRAMPEESKALAAYLKQYGRYGIDPSGRKWDDIYFQEIAGKTPSQEVMDNDPAIHDAVLRSDSAHQPTLKPAVYKPATQAVNVQNLTFTKKEEDIFEDMLAPKPKAKSKKALPRYSDDDVIIEDLSKKSPKSNTGHFIQVGHYVQKTNADKAGHALRKHGKTAVTKDKKSGNMYTVKMGPYSSQQAKKMLRQISAEGHHGAKLIMN
ncbi:MAG: septal ring lytic transglycosylase RlpA family protein [Candidatus Paracaedibacteraceae bacterium]|nr:septal ring lytic transglycosylase RlpA family protein [Candidatus Paracaedibacteraceae bacterium]